MDREKQDTYKRNWLKISGQYVHPDYCANRGKLLPETRTCHVCGNRGKQVEVFECSVFGKCTIDLHQIGQTEGECKNCTRRIAPIEPRWDRKVTGLIPSKTDQNINCSIIDYKGRKLFAYRHNWENARIALCELDYNLNPIWNCKLDFPSVPKNRMQEDPRLFVYRGELHVAFTAVEPYPKTTTHVGYAKLKEVAAGMWVVNNTWLPEYANRTPWEKNWGFFEAADKLWAVYDPSCQSILSIEGNSATLAYKHNVQTATPDYGEIRGGASPILFGGQFYSFFHYRAPPCNYAGSLYTFDSRPPFTPIANLPYPIIVPKEKDCPSGNSNKTVVYPAGAAVIGDEWVISYGGYDHDCRLAGFPLEQIDKSLKSRITSRSFITNDFSQVIDSIFDTTKGWCPRDKAHYLANCVLEHKPKVIVEVGVFEGKSFLPMALAATKVPGCKLIAIDAWDNEVAIRETVSAEHRDWWIKAELETHYQEFIKKLTTHNLESIVEVIRADSNTVDPPAEINLLHVDGSHDATAESDIVRFGRCVVLGGIAVLDDLNWETGNPLAGANWLLQHGFVELTKLGTGAVFKRVALEQIT